LVRIILPATTLRELVPAIPRGTTLPVQAPATLRGITLPVWDPIDFRRGEPKISGNTATKERGGIFGILRETGAMGPGVTGTITEVEMTAADILETPDRMEEAVRETLVMIGVSGTMVPASERARAKEECTGRVKTVIGTATAPGMDAEDRKSAHS
jgi:hypothetical protein